MKAAVLHRLGEPPRYEEFKDPVPEDGEVLVAITAAPINNIDRMLAEGSHYHASRTLPAIPGTLAVGRLEDGTRVAFGGLKEPYGTFAEKAAVNKNFLFPLPPAVDDATAVVLPNSAMSSLVALRSHGFDEGQNVLILGGTGVSGRLAVQVAKHLGAARVTAAGRDPASLERLPALGADHVISLRGDDARVKAAFASELDKHPVDIILDFIWGHPAELLLDALTGHDVTAVGTHRTLYVQIGEMAGADIRLAAATLRSNRIELTGSGGGSVPPEIMQRLPEYSAEVFELAAQGVLTVETELVPLKEIERAWQRSDLHGKRLVITNE